MPLILTLFDGHSQLFRQDVFDTLYAAVSVWAVGSGGDFTNAKNLNFLYPSCERFERKWRPLSGRILRGQ